MKNNHIYARVKCHVVEVLSTFQLLEAIDDDCDDDNDVGDDENKWWRWTVMMVGMKGMKNSCSSIHWLVHQYDKPSIMFDLIF